MPLFHTTITGIVQGVGFRPFIANLARKHRITGTVANKGPYVEIYAQGPASACAAFHRAIQQQPPARAIILTLHTQELPESTARFQDFQIIESEREQGPIYVSPDIATCDDCARELYDPENPRYLHPFINCTNCGPRLTIQESAPYDRCRTTMKNFPMCPSCAAEYHDPQNRRYDAQPVCCPHCGPHVYLLRTKTSTILGTETASLREDGDFETAPEEPSQSPRPTATTPNLRRHDCTGAAAEQPSFLRDSERIGAEAEGFPKDSVKESSVESVGTPLPPPSPDPVSASPETFSASTALSPSITAARRALISGRILALKGIGGFHLACDATNEAAVSRLRARKHRPAKPFALMAESLQTIEQIAIIEKDAQRQLLTGHQKPILLLKKKSSSPERGASPLRAPQPYLREERGDGAGDGGVNIRNGAEKNNNQEPLYGREGRFAPTATEPSLRSDSDHEQTSACRVAPSVAPHTTKLGLLLPYTPLHMLLFHYPDGLDDQMPKLLVMTSGNPSGAPICHTDQEAQEALGSIADLILTHNRPIRLRADDTVLDWVGGHPYPIRRSRGFAPLPIYFEKLSAPFEPSCVPQADKEQSDCFRPLGTSCSPQADKEQSDCLRPLEPSSCVPQADKERSDCFRPLGAPCSAKTGHPSGGRGHCDSERSGEHPSGAEKTNKAALKNATSESPSSPRNIAREDSPRSESAQSPRPTATATIPPRPQPQSLSIGAELKNTFTLARGPLLYPSPYIGDTTDLRTVLALSDSAKLLASLLDIHPQLIACDLHPRYNTTALAEKLAGKLHIPLLKIQHHHAHILSCLAENGETGPVIGLALDGTGYGPDGTIWGGELLLATPEKFTRLATIDPFPQAGGDKAPKEPWRIALALLRDTLTPPPPGEVPTNTTTLTPPPLGEVPRRGGEGSAASTPPTPTDLQTIATHLLHLCTPQEYAAQTFLLDRHLNTVTSTSCGRLFDAISALLGLCTHATYEGEAPTRLQTAAETWAESHPAEAAAINMPPSQREGDREAVEGVSQARPMKSTTAFLRGLRKNSPFRIPTTHLFATLARQRLASLTASPSGGSSPNLTQTPASPSGGSAPDLTRTPASPSGGGGPEGADKQTLGALAPRGRLHRVEGNAVPATTPASVGQLAYTFHAKLALLLADACDRARAATHLSTVALSGGVFQNTLLLTLTKHHLQTRHFRVLTHHEVPPNDGGLSLGQSLAAQWKLTHPDKK